MENLRETFRTPRPSLTRINADTSWLLSLPHPANSCPLSDRSRYNIVIDPWLQGSQTDVGRWFSTQWHQVKSSIRTIQELDTILSKAEGSPLIPATRTTYIDLVVISHELTDHCHKATLLEISSSVPVFASPRAATLIRSWEYFNTVVDIPIFSDGLDWRTTSVSPLPDWVGISCLSHNSIWDPVYGAITIFFSDSLIHPQAAEAVVYSPHGLGAHKFSVLASAQPSIRPLALLHGLHQVTLAGFPANLGSLNAIDTLYKLGARYWLDTHREDKTVTGIVARFLGRKTYTLSHIIDYAKKVGSRGLDSEKKQDIWCIPLGNGESFVLQ